MNKPKRPRDSNQLAKNIVDLATGEIEESIVENAKDSYAVEFARKGGLKGGKARAVVLSSERRSEIARNAAKKRWENKK